MVPVRRHARHWRTYLTCGGLVLGICYSGQALGQQQSSQNGEANANHSQSEPHLPLPPIIEPTYSGLIDQSACQPSQDSHQADFCVAWRTAVATEKQAFWAIWGCLVGIAGIGFVVRTLHYTRVAAEAARVSAQAAERAIQESAKALAHAQDVADRDFRPWLTVNAKLTSQIGTQYSLEKGEITFFIEFSCVNVGKVAARSVVYFAAGIDEVLSGDIGEWFDDLIERAVKACWGDRDALIPSETHVSKRWCQVPGPQTGDFNERMRIARMTCRFRVGIVAAYRGAESDNRVFYTAKVLPVGDPSMVEFFDIITFEDMPLGVGDVALGPVYMARAT